MRKRINDYTCIGKHQKRSHRHYNRAIYRCDTGDSPNRRSRTCVRGIHRSPVNFPHKGQWHGALMFSLICARINGWVNNGEAGDLRRHRAHYDVTVMRSAIRHHCIHFYYRSQTPKRGICGSVEPPYTLHFNKQTVVGDSKMISFSTLLYTDWWDTTCIMLMFLHIFLHTF